MKERALGTCQICEGEFITRDGKMVLHGYQRPGYGEVIGRCPGVNELAYELSCELVKSYLENTKKWLAGAEKRRAELETATYLESYRKSFRTGKMELRSYSIGVSDPFVWDEALRKEKVDVDQRIRWMKDDIARLTRRVVNWMVRELRVPPPKVTPSTEPKRPRRRLVWR